MAIIDMQSYTPGNSFFQLHDKLICHVRKRAEEGFRRNQEKREKITSEELHKKAALELTGQFIESMGGIPYDPSLPLNARITGWIEQEYYTIEKLIFESRSGVYVTANVYVPKNKEKPHGAVLFLCGHSYNAKAMVRYQAAAAIIASCGLTVLTMDPIGQGERKMYVEPDGTLQLSESTVEHNHLGQQCFMVGESLTRYFVADAMKAVDYLMTRPEVDPKKIGVTGCSGGGTQTCVLAVCDSRIAAAAPSCFLSTREYIMQSGGAQDAEQHWLNGASYGFDHHEVLTCFAPKPMLLLTAAKDFFPIEGAEEIYHTGKKLWEMYGAGDIFRIFTDDCFHSYSENMAVEAGRFFAEVLNGDLKASVDPAKIKILTESELYCTGSGYVTVDYPDSVQPFMENLNRYQEKRKLLDESAREKLREKVYSSRVPVEFHPRCLKQEVYNGLDMRAYMWFSQKEMPCYGVLFESAVRKNEKRRSGSACGKMGLMRFCLMSEQSVKSVKQGNVHLWLTCPEWVSCSRPLYWKQKAEGRTRGLIRFFN